MLVLEFKERELWAVTVCWICCFKYVYSWFGSLLLFPRSDAPFPPSMTFLILAIISQTYCKVYKFNMHGGEIGGIIYWTYFKIFKNNRLYIFMADRQGFEPWRRLPAYTLSKRAPSTTRPPVLILHPE